MPDSGKCPDCGAPLSDAALSGQCPECLLRLGLGNLYAPSADLEARDSPDAAGEFLEGTRFGDYDLIEQIARGGMGVIFRARQRSLGREVAIKMVLSGRFASDDEIRRFHREAESAALLDHPNIVSVYDVGRHDETPYLAMALMDRDSLADKIAKSEFVVSAASPASARERQRSVARLLRTLALAAHHAHQHGVIHRDLKPANILFDTTGQPRIADFGLARQLDTESLRTGSSKLAGTPAYMAPEQARLNSSELTTEVDVYALGAVFYELLTGRPPFLGGTPLETLHKLLDEEPAAPHTLNPRIDPDLAVVCLKCLEKRPDDRYDSAAALADELERWLEGRPIEARPTGQLTRLFKWSRRRPAIAGLAGLSIASLLALFVSLVVSRERIEEPRRFAVEQKELADAAARREQREKDRLRTLIERLDFERAESLLANGETAEAFAYLARLVRQSPANRVFQDRLVNALLHEVNFVPAQPPWKQPGGATHVAFSPDGDRLAITGSHGWLQIRDTKSGRRLARVKAHDNLIVALEFDSRGDRILFASRDGIVRVWNAASGAPITAAELGAPVRSATFSPDGRWFATAADDRSVFIWNSETGEVAKKFWLGSPARIVRFSQDSRLLAAGSNKGELRVFELDAPRPQRLKTSLDARINDLRFSPDDRLLAVAAASKSVRLFNMRTRTESKPVLRHDKDVIALAFSPDGRLLATASKDQSLHVWDLQSRDLARPPIRRKTEYTAVRFSPMANSCSPRLGAAPHSFGAPTPADTRPWN